MAKRSLYHDSKTVRALPAPGARTNGTVNGDSVDLNQGGLGDYRTVLFVVATNTITDGTHTVALQDSDDGTVWAAADPTTINGTLPVIAAADDDKVFDFGYIGARRYCRITVTTAAATTGGVFGAVAVLFQTAGYRR